MPSYAREDLDTVFRAAPESVRALRMPLLEIGGLPEGCATRVLIVQYLVEQIAPELGTHFA